MHVPIVFTSKGLIHGKTGFNIISLISIGNDTSEVVLNLVPKKKNAKIRLQNYLSGECFSAVLVTKKHFIYISLTPYWNAMDIVNYNIHSKLVFKKAEGEKT
jgi:hypothetical protein